MLLDSDNGVVCTAVNVICELSLKTSASHFLTLAPILFDQITQCTISNNWLLIKIVKLVSSSLNPEFSAFCLVEGRLIKKLSGPLYQLLNATSSVSLSYEIISTCFTGRLLTRANIDSKLGILCCAKVQGFVTHTDLNLVCIPNL